MRDRIVFFVLGAVLATTTYLIGDLETLTAEDKITELDILRVNRLEVKDDIFVGAIGKNPILITSTNESARIVLLGGELSETDRITKINNSPSVTLEAKNNSAFLNIASHSNRPEATSTLAVVDEEETQFESTLILQDSKGAKVIVSDH